MVKQLSSLITAVFLIFSIAYCSNSNRSTTSEISVQKDSSKINATSAKKHLNELEYNVLDYDSLLLRKRKLRYTRKDLEQVWKQPDSTYCYIAGCSSSPSDSLTMYYFKGVTFTVYEDFAALESISFSLSNETITHPKIKLNKETPIDFFKENFKNSYKKREEYYEDDKLYSTLRFKAHKDWEDIIILLFVNKKLTGLSFWSPC